MVWRNPAGIGDIIRIAEECGFGVGLVNGKSRNGVELVI
jgi:hypothetical protein